MTQIPPRVCIGERVQAALAARQPIVALESAVVSHGLPDPHNVDAAQRMEGRIVSSGAVPAICMIENGHLVIGADESQLAALARDPDRQKGSIRDLGRLLAGGGRGGLTVSATLFASALAGIRVFATGGIGGVHPGDTWDISADLQALGRFPVLTVCSGAKSVLDIPRTLEALESIGVPVYAFRAVEFPGFYLQTSGCTVQSVMAARDASDVAHAHWDLGLKSGIVIGNGIPAAAAISPDDWATWLLQAEADAAEGAISGPALTPYLLDRVAHLSGGATVRANLALLEANAQLAAEIGVALAT